MPYSQLLPPPTALQPRRRSRCSRKILVRRTFFQVTVHGSSAKASAARMCRAPAVYGDFGMRRTVFSTLAAWHGETQRWMKLPAGTSVDNCHVAFQRRLGAERQLYPYVVEFDALGQRYCAPLHSFQACTEMVCEPAVPGEERNGLTDENLPVAIHAAG